MLKKFILINQIKTAQVHGIILKWSCKILYISPERLMTETMINEFKTVEIGLFVKLMNITLCIKMGKSSIEIGLQALSKLKTIFKNN